MFLGLIRVQAYFCEIIPTGNCFAVFSCRGRKELPKEAVKKERESGELGSTIKQSFTVFLFPLGPCK